MTHEAEDWDDKFTPIETPDGETLREDFKEPLPKGALNWWTVLDTDGELTIVPGLKRVNRFAYVVTEEEWTGSDLGQEWKW